MKYTELEIKVISKFNCFMNYETLEDNLNDNCTCLDVKDLSRLTGLDVKTVKGVIGSLTKKNLVFVDEFNMGETALMVTDEGIREYFRLAEEAKPEEKKDEFREYLEKQFTEAQEQFEQYKAEAIRDIQGMTTWNASDFGAAYFTHIDHITQAGTKVQTLAQMIQAYDFNNSSKEEN